MTMAHSKITGHIGQKMATSRSGSDLEDVVWLQSAVALTFSSVVGAVSNLVRAIVLSGCLVLKICDLIT